MELGEYNAHTKIAFTMLPAVIFEWHVSHTLKQLTKLKKRLAIIEKEVGARSERADYSNLSAELNRCSSAHLVLDRRWHFEVALAQHLLKYFEGVAITGTKEYPPHSSQRVKLYLQLSEGFEYDLRLLPRRIKLQQTAIRNLVDLAVAKSTQQIAMESRRDSSSMKTIAILTLVFLPGTYVAKPLNTTIKAKPKSKPKSKSKPAASEEPLPPPTYATRPPRGTIPTEVEPVDQTVTIIPQPNRPRREHKLHPPDEEEEEEEEEETYGLLPPERGRPAYQNPFGDQNEGASEVSKTAALDRFCHDNGLGPPDFVSQGSSREFQESRRGSRHHGSPQLDNLHYGPPQLDPRQMGPRHMDSRRMDPRQMDPHRIDPRKMDPRQMDPHQMDPRQMDPRHVDPHHFNPRQMDPRQMDPRRMDPRQIDPRRMAPRQIDPRHHITYGPTSHDGQGQNERQLAPMTLNPRHREPEPSSGNALARAVAIAPSSAVTVFRNPDSPAGDIIALPKFATVPYSMISASNLSAITSIFNVTPQKVPDWCKIGLIERDNRTQALKMDAVFALFDNTYRARWEVRIQEDSMGITAQREHEEAQRNAHEQNLAAAQQKMLEQELNFLAHQQESSRARSRERVKLELEQAKESVRQKSKERKKDDEKRKEKERDQAKEKERARDRELKLALALAKKNNTPTPIPVPAAAPMIINNQQPAQRERSRSRTTVVYGGYGYFPPFYGGLYGRHWGW
ncbi:hypothetical protein MMC14_008773 [Varicellaria rhodocarpa]|nr:hypothetical protein [Varicellaria rhodocarpa]